MGTVNSVHGGKAVKNKINFVDRKKSLGSQESRNHSPAPPTSMEDSENSLHLSPQQKQLVKDTWNHVDDKHEFAHTIFLNIFKTIPNLKQAFVFADVPDDQLTRSAAFNLHCTNFAKFLNTVISTFECDETAVIELAKKVGARHVTYCQAKGVRFDSQYLKKISEILVDEFVNEQKKLGEYFGESRMTKHIKTTWSTLFDQLIETMRHSYCETELKQPPQH